MKTVFLILLFSLSAHAKFVSDGCPNDQLRQQGPNGYYCAPINSLFQSPYPDCVICQQAYYQRQMQANPWASQTLPWNYNPYTPWWAQQGQLFYPNFNYPGSWQYPGINTRPYPGDGGVFAAKPNVYVKADKLQSFKLQFDLSKGANFLATTPWLSDDTWEGLTNAESFRVENVKYDYLFYDARLDHKVMQFQAGWCVHRDKLVGGMVKELSELGFSQAALKDFDEHWSQKIPQEPVYCVYPQYNAQLDLALPVTLTPKAPFMRVVFIVVPHRVDDRRPASQMYPELPRNSHVPLRPERLSGALQFMEWGVAFLDHTLIK